MGATEAYRTVRSQVLEALNTDTIHPTRAGRVAFGDDLGVLLTGGGSYFIPPSLRDSLNGMRGLIRLRTLTPYEQAVLCRYTRQLLALYATRSLPVLPALHTGPGCPPALLSVEEHELALAAQRAGIDWLEVGLMAGAVVGGAALMVSGLGVLGAAVGGVLGQGVLGSAVSQGVTGAAQHAIPEVAKAASGAWEGERTAVPVQQDGRTLASLWRGVLGVGELPDSYQEMRRLHREAVQRHERFVRDRERVLRHWKERVAAVERMLPLQPPGGKQLHAHSLGLWGLTFAAILGWLLTASVLGDVATLFVVFAFVTALMAMQDRGRTSTALGYQESQDEDLLQYALDFQHMRQSVEV